MKQILPFAALEGRRCAQDDNSYGIGCLWEAE
jgi:hypothetical protein